MQIQGAVGGMATALRWTPASNIHLTLHFLGEVPPARIEIAYLSAALRRTNGKKTAAANLLRIDPQRMKYLCRKLKL